MMVYIDTMETWIFLSLIVSMLEVTSNFEIEKHCKLNSSRLEGQQLTCTNVNLNYFLKFDIPVNRTHWLKCENCSLNILTENTFNIAIRNNIKFLDFTDSDIRILRKFAFIKFPLLKYLILRNNNIETLDSMCFNSIKNLLQLDLSTNNIKILTNNLFSELENLDILSLHKNQIFHVQPEAFAGLLHLKYLYLNNNYLKRLEENMFRHLISLKILYIENNNIVEIHPNAFVNLRNLNCLYMNNNSISYLVQYNFKGLTSLLDLQLRSNNLREIQTSSFNGLKKIKSLHLGDNEINFVKPYGFIGLDTLEILELVGNQFKFISYFEYFSHMVNLKYLWLKKNNINDFTIEYKYEVQNSLTVLDLGDNNLTRFNYKLLYKYMPNIREVFVANNSWTCEFFINMYNFLEEKNVSICISDSCNSDAIQIYMEDICIDLKVTEVSFEESPIDFSTDCSPVINSSILVITALMLVFI
ncbi:hypothetical protein NQ314_021006 [Rhamnusium bicolor]|uniref:Uncharacterized protein n=1 Tax=Rhamnusium bicolor TaxID=1586634 RepID=A0AAV8WJ48_9CUCU|nr:hypothetical protein NQ314_021006 [Rhamnusium bicolor]